MSLSSPRRRTDLERVRFSDTRYRKVHRIAEASHRIHRRDTMTLNTYTHHVSGIHVSIRLRRNALQREKRDVNFFAVFTADQKAALQEILLHHQNNQYAPNLLPPSPRALSSATTDPLLLTPVLTPHLTSGTSNLPAQPQIGPPLMPLPHEHSPAGINTLYSSLQSAPKKRKLSQDGLIHVKQVRYFICTPVTSS